MPALRTSGSQRLLIASITWMSGEAAMAFKGWPRALIEFYDELEVHNTKAWWEAHKATYEQDVKAPMEALLEELRGEFGEAKLFRPYRDIRFSKDKTPYKLECAATIRDPKGGGYDLARERRRAGRRWGHVPLRRGSAGALPRRGGPITQRRGPGQAGRRVGEGRVRALRARRALKTVPRGSEDHPRGDLLKRKGVISVRATRPRKGVVHSAKARDWVTETLRAGSDMATWLRKHVGPGTEPFGRGR